MAKSTKFKHPINRTFMGLPVLEAKVPLYVQPNAQDIKEAKPGDPENCMYARCIKRVYESSHTVIYKAIAYVQLLDADGERVYRRFELSPAMRNLRHDFDLGKKIAVHGLHLNPPGAGHRLDYRIGQYQRRVKNGYKPPDPNRPDAKKRTKPVEATLVTRDGCGMVRFLKAAGGEGKVRTRYGEEEFPEKFKKVVR